MRALTIRQPHIGHLIDGRKPAEFRTWYTSYRGPLALHAASHTDSGADRDAVRSAVLATARLVAIVEITAANRHLFAWDGEPCPVIGEYAWLFEDVQPFAQPLSAHGTLGLWEWRGPTQPALF